MLIGRINFGDGKKVDKLSIQHSNLIICLKDYYYEKRYAILRCKKCSQLLVPAVEHVGPNNCGWVYQGGWVCHQCNSHGAMEGTKEEVKEHMKMVAKRNENIKCQMWKYKLSHPWVKFKEK